MAYSNVKAKGGKKMDDCRIAILAIVVEDTESVDKINEILHRYGEYIIGRMGLPYCKRKISLISVAFDAPASVISAVSGKIGMIDNVTCKAVFAKTEKEN